MQLPDHELVERCRQGHADDFRFLIDRYQGSVFTFIAARHRDRTLARDATEETFVRAYFSLDKLEKPAAFHSWVLGIARRVGLEMVRAPHRRYEVEETLDPAAPADVDQLLYPDLDAAIAGLPDLPRRLILLRYYERLSCQEIADRFGMPLGTVTKTLSRAYTELRQELAAPESQPARTEIKL